MAIKGVFKRGRKPRRQGKQPVAPQAKFIIDKFGGPYELARTLKAFTDDPRHHLNVSTIYRWTYPVDKQGTGGEIPAYHLPTILAAARFAGIFITPKDVYPHLFPHHNTAKVNDAEGE